ncbi:hypothetical protein [Qipengyuania gelatinilytica]|uniref:Uncharacterized protein n=1 Tax=Qipengyuania gelatinilytica TaxID=2867231 RepID=A0ABX9A2R8_9SPHN|nr:hypothetical protein [Qipengyuania gelatinilytica]QZD95352.1 hypothetical protein K3136_01085 [Qipengyuania gelatinilytica]
MKRLVASIALAAVAATSATAQTRSRENETDVSKQRAAVEAWTACIANERTDEVREVLALDFRSDEYRNKMKALAKARVSSECFNAMPRSYRKIELGGLPFAGGLAEQVIEMDDEPLLQRLSMAALAGDVPTYSRTDAIAQCMARGAPHLVAILFDTEINSGEEIEALAELQPVSAACTRGAALEASPFGMRSMLATASYRLLVAANEEGKEV